MDGTEAFTATEIDKTALTAPGYYAGMGFGVPAGIGVAATGRRPLAAAASAIQKRVTSRAADIAPTIARLQAGGATTLRALAAALNGLGVTAARGGEWDATQVWRLLAVIGDASAPGLR
jgi:hypothetical protein